MINQQWDFRFVNPEEINQMRQDYFKDAIDKKMCKMCENAILVNDSVAFCNAAGSPRKGQCVDEYTGENCEYWVAATIV